MTKNYTLTKEWQKIELTATGGSSFLIRKTGANDCIVYIAENDSDFENAIILTEPIALNLTENRFIYAKASINGAMINITNFFYDAISGDVTTPAITTATLTLSNENLTLPAYKAEDITITAEVASNWDFKIDDESIASAKRLNDTKLRITALKAGATCINDAMKEAAVYAISSMITEDMLDSEHIIVSALDPRVADVVAQAVTDAAKESGVVRE